MSVPCPRELAAALRAVKMAVTMVSFFATQRVGDPCHAVGLVTRSASICGRSAIFLLGQVGKQEIEKNREWPETT